jgi:pimeloyl-ACP methyl ester carboxylesterase
LGLDYKDLYSSWTLKTIDQYLQLPSGSIFTRQLQQAGEGNLPTLLFLHDALGCVASWKDFPFQLCEALSCHGLLYDRLGHGASDASPNIWKKGYLEYEAKEVLPEIISHFGLLNPILLGLSDGGSIALLYGTQESSCKAIISIAGHMQVEAITQQAVAATRAEPMNSRLRSGLGRYHGEKAEALLGNWQRVWTSQTFANWDMSKKLCNIDCPVMLIQGEKDAFATPRQASSMAEHIGKNARLHLLPGLGHFPTKEAPGAMLSLLTTFLNPLIQ